MKRKLGVGITSVSLPIFVQDVTSSTGAGLSGLTSGTSGLVMEYRRQGQSAWTSVTLVSGTLGTYTSGGIVADGALAGAYEIGVPDAAFASGARFVIIRLRGAANMLPVLIEIELDAVNYQDAAGFGLSRIDTDVSSRLAPTVPGRTLDVSAGGEAGIDWSNVGSPTSVLFLSGTTIKTATDVEADTADIQSRVPAALVAGKMDSSVGGYQTGQAPLQPATAGRTLYVNAGGQVSSEGDLDAAEIREALGLGGADMDTKFGELKADTESLLARIPVTLFTGITSLADWIRRIVRKDAGTAGMTTAQNEINTGGATPTFAGTTDALEAISDAVPKYGDTQQWNNGTDTLNVTVTKV